MATASERIRVKVKGKSVAFPSYCPHCLRPATVNIGIQSGRKLVGYYVFYSRWKHSTIQVPFCAQFDQRLRAVGTYCICTFFVLIAVFILIILTTQMALEGWQGALFLGAFMTIISLPRLIVRPGMYIKLLAAQDDFIEFSIRQTEYARMLVSMNEVIPLSEHENTFLEW
jgi:hypothetical protein